MTRRPPRSTLFPSPPLSRSESRLFRQGGQVFPDSLLVPPRNDASRVARVGDLGRGVGERATPKISSRQPFPVSPEDRQELLLRSEEHTSELQSRQYLVCRLL